MSKKVIIKFMGPPACGKTYTMQFLEARIKEQAVGAPHLVIHEINNEEHEMTVEIVDGRAYEKPRQ